MTCRFLLSCFGMVGKSKSTRFIWSHNTSPSSVACCESSYRRWCYTSPRDLLSSFQRSRTQAFWDILPCRLVNGHRRFDGYYCLSLLCTIWQQRKRPEDLKLLTSNSSHFIFYEMCRNSLLIQLCTCGSTVVSVPVFIKWHFKHKCWFRYNRI